MAYAVIAVASAMLCCLLTWLIRRTLINNSLLDIPNERSMHQDPVPRGGGLAIMAVIISGMALAMNVGGHVWLIVATLMLIAISWLDDRKDVRVELRLGVHILAAGIGSMALPMDATIFNGMIPFWLDRAIAVLAWAWFLNLYNFMDGIDGITGVESISIAIGVGAVLYFLGFGDMFDYTLISVITGACIGFLVFNWHPARIFMGDVGSIPLGFLTGYLLLKTGMQYHLMAALILPLYYLADSGITIALRLLRKEKIWQAHRQHFYQRATQYFKEHDKTVKLIGLANAALIGTAMISINDPWPGIFLAVIIVAILIGKMHKVSGLEIDQIRT
ncbi:MAG: glycosyltransferase family 4 protein [Alphaproteobacteria bacterium]|nr:glycosyltransferase family 4 protein [Alphaproteobacteria bacterium]